MNANDSAQSSRPPFHPSSAGPNSRPTQDGRNGHSPAINVVSTNGVSRTAETVMSPGALMSRAEKFEDEKRRIIENCFGKKEIDGSISESYITHIRILEDAAHPSNPPPLQSPSENKKPRVIVIAVRKSGRVRMHKARENANGSFSIGKTWVLDDLTMIQSFTNAIPLTSEEQQNKERAGATGFVVTIQKPYYWQAATAKEKDFFIYSLIKIYKKYTGGNLPELYGFDPQELEQLAGASGPQSGAQPKTPKTPQTQSSKGENGVFVQGPSSAQGRPPVPQQAERSRGPGGDTRSRPSPERSSRERAPQIRSPQERPIQPRSSQERILRTTDSNDRMPYIPGQYPSSEFVRNLNPQTSRPPIKNKRSDSPGYNEIPGSTSVQQESNFRKQPGAQSGDSFRTRQERTLGKATPNGQPSEERVRQTSDYATSTLEKSSVGQQLDGPDYDKLPSTLRAGSSEHWHPSQSHRRDGRPSSSSSKPSSSQKTSETALNYEGPAMAVALEPQGDNIKDNSNSEIQTEQGDRSGDSHQLSARERDEVSVSTDPQVENQQHLGSSTAMNNISPPSLKQTGTADVHAMTSPPPAMNVSTNSPPEVEEHRPGLGPMIKKKSNKEIASTFRKAATAYNAFKPRPGGAAEKFRNENQKSFSEHDGISSVFPAPSLLKSTVQSSSESPMPSQPPNVGPFDTEPRELPTINIDTSSAKTIETVDSEASRQETLPSQKALDAPKDEADERSKKRRSDHSSKYARMLGINQSLLEGRTYEIESMLNDFGWGEETRERTTYEELQSGLRKEINRVEAGSWLGALENNDERVTAVGSMMDRVMAECEELDSLLTLYNVELGTLSEDVAYIEAQSQGLQVQTANQKLLHTELQNLLDTISISVSDLQILRDASLTKPQGLQVVETTLSHLYTAMLTIDPKLRQNGTRPDTSDQISVDRSSINGFSGNELSSMRAVREKKAGYRKESVDFIKRFRLYLSVKFREVEAQTNAVLEQRRRNGTSRNLTRLDHRLREKPRADLWLYSPLMLFTREMETTEWQNFMRMYESSAKKPYQDEFRENIVAWKSITRKPVSEEDVLFTAQEKESESLVGRKLTVKRSKTVGSDGSSRISTGEKPKDGKVNAYEAFAGTLSEMARMILVEQNFVVDLFHITSLETFDFLDAVAIAPEVRRGGDPTDKKISDPDRNMSKRVLSTMEEIYSSWPKELQDLVDWVVKQDALQGVGVLLSLESQLSELEDTNQEFLTHTIAKVHDRLVTHLGRFVDEQIRAIEDTKVKLKKRKGIISFVKTFPNFSFTVENMLPPLRNLLNPPIRLLINDAYQKINKAMFESLKFIATENPTARSVMQGQTQSISAGAGDPEDKEALNYQILLIENMNHYSEEVAPRDNAILEEWKAHATREMEHHMHLYVSAIVRRPLGKLLDFLESTESLLRQHAASSSPGTAIASRASHSRPTFRKLLAAHDAREIRRGIETLRKRIDKHFGGDTTEDADPLRRAGLVAKVLSACEAEYLDVGERVKKVADGVYEGGVEVEWRREDVVGAFRR